MQGGRVGGKEEGKGGGGQLEDIRGGGQEGCGTRSRGTRSKEGKGEEGEDKRKNKKVG